MKIQTYSLGSMQANCYFLISGEECIIIDPADEASFILEKLQSQKLSLVAMIASHGHFDHIMAAGEIQLTHSVPFYIHEKDMFLVNRLNETAQHFLGFDPHVLPPKNIEFVNEGKLIIRNIKLKIISTPGHTPGSVSIYSELDKCIFTGDTLFKQAIGRYDFSYSDKNLLKDSLSNLSKLPPHTIVYPGHGEETTIGNERLG